MTTGTMPSVLPQQVLLQDYDVLQYDLVPVVPPLCFFHLSLLMSLEVWDLLMIL